MDQPTNSKNHREATKQLLIAILKTTSGMTILLSRPAGSVYYPEYFFKNGEFDRTKFRRTLRHASSYGYVNVKERGDELTITLKDLGHARALKYSIEDLRIVEPDVWDKKWRLVIFDIPETMRLARNVFKDKLDEMGFAQIQKSAYVHPYPCHNEIEFMRSLYGLDSYIRMGVLEKVEGDDALRKRFGL